MAENPGIALSTRRLAITVRGVVQGVGFRPFVYNAARSRGLSGWVRNEAGSVRIEVQGDPSAVEAFVEALRRDHPPQARVDGVKVEEISPLPKGEETAFEIRTSEGTSAPRPTIPADLATCRDCLAEIFDPAQRRYRYPFTNCTNCGPRWSIIGRLPYDRPQTSMASFEMCAECRAEYEDPADRRFHAQPIACPRCGPVLRLLDNHGAETATGDAALVAAAEAVRAGRIVALKGLGGFQLLVDATDAAAVARLRERKHRPDRPFAVMLASLAEARTYCRVSDEEAEALSSHQSPIVLVRRAIKPRPAVAPGATPPPNVPSRGATTGRGLAPEIVPGVAPGNPYLGVMLPYTPLHHLLMAVVGRPIICTSGNLSEEPMAIDREDALRRLGHIADLLLTHNRPIVRPVDDSIVRVGPAGSQVLRRARGFAPLPIRLCDGLSASRTVLAVGGHLKNAVALALGRVGQAERSPTKNNVAAGGTALRLSHPTPTEVVMSAHVGDLDNVLSVGVFRRAIDDLLKFFQAAPDVVACDLHPDYASTQHAERLSARWGVPLRRVQHHHAHVAACMAEHGLPGPVLGFSWDGTGYGPDGTVWGGEALVCEGAEYRRVAHLRTFALPGGDRAVRQPRRSALGVLFELLGQDAAELAAAWFSRQELDQLLPMLQRRIHAPRTSSMGRLFDAVAAICGLPTKPQPAVAPGGATTGRGFITFEGQAAMALEYAADESEPLAYPFALSACDCGAGVSPAPPLQAGRLHHKDAVLDWEPLVRGVLADRAADVHVGRISARFHNALADVALAVAQSLPTPLPVVLSGGCFQNALLTDRIHSRLSAAGFQVYTHSQAPPGDGGIALGQAFVALQQVD